MELKPGSNRELVYKKLDIPMTLKQIEKNLLPKKVSSLRSVLYQLYKSDWINQTGKGENAIFMRKKKTKKTKTQHPNRGNSAKIEDYLKARIGQIVVQKELKKALKFEDISISSKLTHLVAQGRIQYDHSTRPSGLIVMPSIVDHVKKGGTKPIRGQLTDDDNHPPPPALTDNAPQQAVGATMDLGAMVNHMMIVNQQMQNHQEFINDLLHLLEKHKILEED